MEQVWITKDHSITSMMMPGGSIIDDVIDATIAKLKLNITCLQVEIWFRGNKLRPTTPISECNTSQDNPLIVVSSAAVEPQRKRQ